MEQPTYTKKSLGQHFLKDSQLAYNIVKLLDIQKGESVFEIGPGEGALTKHIINYEPGRFYLIEKDTYWAKQHFVNSRIYRDYVKVFHADALKFPWESLHGSWKIISNLPYNIGSPLIWDVVSRVHVMNQAVFMVQKEVAERLCATPGNKSYGALSVWVQSFVKVNWGVVVKPQAFKPPPKVDSAVVVMYPKTQEEKPQNRQVLAKIIKICFQQRRKQIQSILRNVKFSNVIEVLERIGVSPLARPESLSNIVFQQLSQEFYPQLIDFP